MEVSRRPAVALIRRFVNGFARAIEVKPRKWGWCVFESPGVEPVFLQKDQAIGYAETRARLRTGEIRIFDSTGKVERVIAFDDANRRL
jgi:hypothetical protein